MRTKHKAIVAVYGELKKPVFSVDNIDLNSDIEFRIFELRGGGTEDSPEYYCGSEYRKTPVPVGCWGRMLEGMGSYIFSYYGPNINYGHLPEYARAAKNLRTIEKKIYKLPDTDKGWTQAVNNLYRWLTACGVKEAHHHVSGYPMARMSVEDFCDLIENTLK